VVVCAGSGGVGKTTVSAAIAAGAAAQGKTAAVLTIDPAKRLANSLGLPERFTNTDAEAMTSLNGGGTPAAREAVKAALTAHGRERAQRSQVARLKRGLDAPVATLPFLFTPEVELEDLELLSVELERKL